MFTYIFQLDIFKLSVMTDFKISLSFKCLNYIGVLAKHGASQCQMCRYEKVTKSCFQNICVSLHEHGV